MLSVRSFATRHLPHVFDDLGIDRYPARPDFQSLVGFRRVVHDRLGKAHSEYLVAHDAWKALGVKEVPEIEDMSDDIFDAWNVVDGAKKRLFSLRCAWEIVRDLPEAWSEVPGAEERLRGRISEMVKIAPEGRRTLQLFSDEPEFSPEHQALARELVGRIPRTSLPDAVRCYGSREVLADYLQRVFDGWGNKPGNTLQFADVVLWPVSTGADPRDPSTAEWAQFACRRQLDERMANEVYALRFPMEYDAIALYSAGVPVEYALIAAPSKWRKYPTKGILKAWRAGVPAEYLALAFVSKEGKSYPVKRIVEAYKTGVPIEYVMAAHGV